MIDHQHSILTALGIDFWVPRDAVCEPVNAASLWRDQAPSEIHVDHAQVSSMQVKPRAEIQTVVSQQIESKPIIVSKQIAPKQVITANTISQTHPRHFSESIENSEIVQQKSVVNTSVISVLDSVDAEKKCQPFQLQAMVVANITLVIESTDFNLQQWALWRNIQQIFSAKTSTLEWPFPLLHIQDARGVICYIQGFLDATGLDQTILCLGDLPYMQVKGENMPSIAQMLEQPALKKQLWQKLYQSSHS